MNSAKQIIEKESFKSVTFSNIAKLTKLSRPSIYKYYQFPEEILSNILEIEFSAFNDELAALKPTTLAELQTALVSNILKRDLMMKLLAINFSIIEDNIREEPFLAFKQQIFRFMNIIETQIKLVTTTMKHSEIERIKYSLLTMMAAIYPVTHDDGNHVALMQNTNPQFYKPDYEELLTENIAQIFKVL
ncbi:TetR/AcrR family transcriptional regulator [Lactobacillus sp. Sy-1]|uniref:TetR/AcrR family transcriptional regulator n=1 Tax=Lactobacillus sp. Sy-1 TaxID=2109645 RepID=UPI001C5B6D77|nr:TetR/AcrR family transcriptional regulator [Lactobacillus sp. Sy-1]MBW1605873.1 hypothetical protein [Lactobacillus sp. Sy-1]